LRLKTTLALQDAGILNESGKLTESAIKTSELAMRPGSTLSNPSVVKALTKGSSSISDWEKLTTRSVEMPTGQRIQVHFYRNKITGEVNYTHPDFKVKNPVNLFPSAPETEPTVTPPYNHPY
jgi:filamentous hemagglutinin